VNFRTTTAAARTWAVFGNHWPSRSGGQFESEGYRAIAGETLGYFHQRVLEVHGPQTPVLAMGDSTTNRSMFPLFGMHSAPGSEPRSPQATDSQIDAAVILGAGFDTRAYRLPVLAATPVYEIDLPANIDRKRTRLTKLFGGIPANVTLVPIDVETQDLADVSANHGYRPERPTFFVWEAVTQYLTEAGVRKTFDFLATAAPGSHLVFTYVAQWPRVATVGDRTFSLRQKDLVQIVRRRHCAGERIVASMLTDAAGGGTVSQQKHCPLGRSGSPSPRCHALEVGHRPSTNSM